MWVQHVVIVVRQFWYNTAWSRNQNTLIHCALIMQMFSSFLVLYGIPYSCSFYRPVFSFIFQDSLVGWWKRLVWGWDTLHHLILVHWPRQVWDSNGINCNQSWKGGYQNIVFLGDVWCFSHISLPVVFSVIIMFHYTIADNISNWIPGSCFSSIIIYYG